MLTGTVKWYDRAKRFGFITSDEGTDVYVHATAVASGRLNAGDVVEFTTEDGERGQQATAVTVVQEAEPAATSSAKELLDSVEAVVRRLDGVAQVLREGRSVGAQAAFYAARDMRRLASRLNPPAV
ncbi:cold-shock protein [Actinokineospora sp. 24-640]